MNKHGLSLKEFFRHGPVRWSVTRQPSAQERGVLQRLSLAEAGRSAVPGTCAPRRFRWRTLLLVLVMIAACFGFREYWNIYKNVARNYSGTEPLFNSAQQAGVIIACGTAASGEGALQQAIAQGARYLALEPRAGGERFAFGAQELSLEEVKQIFLADTQRYLVLTGAVDLEAVLEKLSLPRRLVVEVDTVPAYRAASAQGVSFPVLRVASKEALRDYMTRGMLRPHVISMISLPAALLEEVGEELAVLRYSGVNVLAHDCEDARFLKNALGSTLSAAFSATVTPAVLDSLRRHDTKADEKSGTAPPQPAAPSQKVGLP